MIGVLRKPQKFLVFAVTAVIILAIIGTIIYYLVENNVSGAVRIPRGAVVTNGHACAEVGAAILDRKGTAVEAAIAALFCEGISMPHSMGVGGGFLMTIYSRTTGTAMSLNARETAPEAANETMFNGNGTTSTRGGLAAGVPGELRGYYAAYQKYGGVTPWKDLVQPTIDLCKNGILVTEYLARFLQSQAELLLGDEGLRDEFIDPKTNRPFLLNQYIKRPRLAKTLELIAEDGPDVLYNGTLTQGFVQDIQDHGGIITVEDMNNYQPEWQNSTTINLASNQTLFTTPLPGSGVILSFIFNILDGFLDRSSLNLMDNWQKIIESFKFGYGKRTELGDMNFLTIDNLIDNLTSPDYARIIRQSISLTSTSQNPEDYGAKTVPPEDHGTAHISVLAPNGDAVSVTSTINLYFGAGFMSLSTGIILNDQMDDFSSPNLNNSFGVPPSIANYIKPGKRPLSSMTPSIFVGADGEVELVIGAAGGTKITTSVAQIAIKNLWFGVDIQDAVSDRRMHHQLFPMQVQLESDFSQDQAFLDGLTKIGHEYDLQNSTGFSAVTAISRKGSTIRTATDRRRSGESKVVY